MKKTMNSLKSSIRWARPMRSLGIAILAAFAASATANAQILFTTQQDFTGWTDAGNGNADLTLAPSVIDLDGVTINGLGNTTAAGSAGTASSLAISDSVDSGWSYNYEGCVALDESGNAAFISALENAQYITIQYNTPYNVTGSGYLYAIELILSFNGNGQNIIAPINPCPGTQCGPNNGSDYIQTYDVTSFAAALSEAGPITQLGFGVNLNGYLDMATINVDAITAVPPPPPSQGAVGVHFVNSGGSDVNDSSPDALAPTSETGLVLQTNWNNLGNTGDTSGGPLLYDGGNNLTSLSIEWDSDTAGSTGTFTSGSTSGTPFGALFDGFIYSYSEAVATPLGNSVYNSSESDKPCIWIGGLQDWYQSQPGGAAGYNIILYTCTYAYWESEEGFVESVTGSPLNDDMVEGDVLSPPLFSQETGNQGSFIPVVGTSVATQNGGSDYMQFSSLTNDEILIRLQGINGAYGAGVNGFQIVPVTSLTPPVLPSVTLTSTNGNGNMTMFWSAGTLQTATNVLGPWTYDYTPSPDTYSMTNPAQFFRVWVGGQ